MAQIIITEDYVSLKTARLLKEKGFDVNCITKYRPDDSIGYWSVEGLNAPTLQMAMKWLREVHNIHVELTPICTGDSEDDLEWHYGWAIKTTIFTDRWTRHNAEHISYEEACEAAIKYCLENLI